MELVTWFSVTDRMDIWISFNFLVVSEGNGITGEKTDSCLVESLNAPYCLVSMAEIKYEAFQIVINLTRNSFQLLILFVTEVLCSIYCI